MGVLNFDLTKIILLFKVPLRTPCGLDQGSRANCINEQVTHQTIGDPIKQQFPEIKNKCFYHNQWVKNTANHFLKFENCPILAFLCCL